MSIHTKWDTHKVVKGLWSIQAMLWCQMGYDKTFGFQNVSDAGIVNSGDCASATETSFSRFTLCQMLSCTALFSLHNRPGGRYFIIPSPFCLPPFLPLLASLPSFSFFFGNRFSEVE